jgi:hypothetical protein
MALNMVLRKIILLICAVLIQFSYAQKRKKVDTVYVYENVIVYDTVYLIKPVKFKQNDVILPDLNIQEKFFVRNIYEEETERQRAKSRIRKQQANLFQYGIEGGIGFKNSSWAKELSGDRGQSGEYLRLWLSRRVFTSNLYLMISAQIDRWNSTFDLDANREETYLNGYYFTKDHQPLLFQKFNNRHFEYALQLKLLYEWKNIRPFAGISANRSTYKMQFMVPENGVLSKLDDFKTDQTNIGFSLGAQYRCFRRFLLTLEYQQHRMKNVSLKNSSFDFDIFKTNNTFAERKVSFGVSYIISRP